MEKSKYYCDYRGCGHVLLIERKAYQVNTGSELFVLVCSRNWRHRFNVITSIGSLIRMHVSRWSKQPIGWKIN